MDRGHRLKILRMLCGQSQDALAKELRLSQGNVATWERKGMFPRDSEIAKKLAELLQAPVGYLAFGEPHINSAVWEPLPPQSPRHLKSYLSDVKSLFPEFCLENKIEIGAYYSAENGKIAFLGQEGKSFSYLLIIRSVISECMMESLGGVKLGEIKVLAGYPPLKMYLDEFDLEQLEIYIRAFEDNGYSIDRQAIGSALVKMRRLQYGKADIPNSIEITFAIFHRTLLEFALPQVWPDDLMFRLSHIFKRVHEMVMEKPLVGEGIMDESLVEYINQLLTGSGLKKRKIK
jgi:transcriptional regulator with XRE-family HTH domain